MCKKKEGRELIEGVTSVDETSKFYLKVPLGVFLALLIFLIYEFVPNWRKSRCKKPLPPMSFPRLLMGRRKKKEKGEE
ncbi:hypothetical protein CEXT_297751 [Caerostris extrusa]|uniref:Uncharacterized protein n=1 Tax=Caerostris extrusa TaxID=172846 RepID=A0AAV4VLM8_CAEEX|nr:hypothetical protein CEXT_297751 [Caerostris extrusa]